MQTDTPRRSLIVRLFNPWVTIPCGLLLIVVAAPFVYRSSRLHGVPPIEVLDVEAYLDFEIDENAGCWPDYRRAVGMMVDPGPYEARDPDRFHNGYFGWESAVPAFRDYVDANEATLSLWRTAVANDFAPRVHPRRRSYFDNSLPVAKTREFSRLAILRAEREMLEGEPAAAWPWYAACLRDSRHMIQRGALIERLVSCAIVAMVADPIGRWASHESVTTEQLQAARRLVGEITAATPPLEEAVKIEYVMLRNALHDATPSERAGFLDLLDGPGRLSWIENEYALGIRLVDHQYAQALEASRLDWVSLQGRVGKHGYLLMPTYIDAIPGDQLFDSTVGSRFLKAVGYGNSTQASEAVFRDASRLRALNVVLAAEIHRREHGAYPEKASDLVPDLLAAVPEDPFAKPGTPLQYAIRKGRPSAWSTGPNGVNDDGRFYFPDDMDDIGVPFGEPRFDEDGDEGPESEE